MKNLSILFLLSTHLILGNSTFSQDEKVKEFRINPNPTNGIVNIEIKYADYSGNTHSINTDIEVYNTNGELILKKPYHSIQGGLITISDTFYLTGCSSGIYLVKLYALGYLFVARLLLIK